MNMGDRNLDMADRLMATPRASRSRSPHNSAGITLPQHSVAVGHTSEIDLARILRSNTKKLPTEVHSRVLNAMREFKDGVSRKSKALETKKQNEEEKEKLLKMKDPNGVKPFRCNDTDKMLDEAMVGMADEHTLCLQLVNGAKMTLEFQRPPTFRDGLRAAHYGYWAMVKDLHMQIEESRLHEIQTQCDFDVFVAKCVSQKIHFPKKLPH
eukprot:1524602-Karenia_brevis.AAC.1